MQIIDFPVYFTFILIMKVTQSIILIMRYNYNDSVSFGDFPRPFFHLYDLNTFRLFQEESQRDRLVTPEGDLVLNSVTEWDSQRFACWIRRRNRAIYSLGQFDCS